MSFRFRCLGCVLAVAFVLSASAAQTQDVQVQRIDLDNGTISLQVTPSFGGRVLALGRHGQPNLIKVGDAVQTQSHPQVSAQAGDVAYLGHDVWVGPQSQWWVHQRVNAQRRAAAANWPPDPYLSLARTDVVLQQANELWLRGPDSPVSGVRLEKRFALSAQRQDTVVVEVEATNIRDQPVAWDLWFNTRAGSGTRVFVPLASKSDLRVQPSTEAGFDGPPVQWQRGLVVVDARASTRGRAQRGKLLLQPAAGWMAGFSGSQALVIRFDHQPRQAIHPEQGQIELYLDAPSARPSEGLLELEVHAPYRQLASGEQMRARERWTVLAYHGADTRDAQRRFLCQQAQALALHGACVP